MGIDTPISTVCDWNSIRGAEAKGDAIKNVGNGADAGVQWACKQSMIMPLNEQNWPMNIMGLQGMLQADPESK